MNLCDLSHRARTRSGSLGDEEQPSVLWNRIDSESAHDKSCRRHALFVATAKASINSDAYSGKVTEVNRQSV